MVSEFDTGGLVGEVAAVARAPSAAQSQSSRRPVLRFLLRRVPAAILTLLAATIVIFAATDLLPGSPAGNALGRFATKSEITALDHRLGYDRPLPVRYVDWLGKTVRGDLGSSAVGLARTQGSAPIWPMIRGRLLNTLTLALLTVALLIPLSLFLGTLTAVRAGRPLDHVVSMSVLALISLPEFVTGSLLILLFFTVLHWLPPASLLAPDQAAIAHPRLLALPVLTLLATTVAWTTRLVRAGMIEVLESDYVRTARLHGLRERRVLLRYALRNALAPSVQVLALTIQWLFGGIVVVEVLFSYPGLGKELVDGVLIHDTPLVQAIALLVAAFYIGVALLADLIVLLLVPRLRTQQ
jgi:peptide/nickel transport system permease protein